MSGDDVAADRADRFLREHDVQTTVPAAFFDDLLEALDRPARPNEALMRVANSALPRDLDFRL